MLKNTIQALSDEALMQAYQIGEMAAFNELYSRHQGKVKGYFIKRGGSFIDAEDFCQRVFMKLHDSKNRYDPQLPFLGWFFVLVKNLWIDFLRAQNTLKKTDLRESEGELARDSFESVEPPLPNIEEAMMVKEWLKYLFANLEEEEKELLSLKFGMEYSYEEIAKKLGVSEVSLRKKVSRLLKGIQVKTQLKEEDSQ